jgi:hypothetical protein
MAAIQPIYVRFPGAYIDPNAPNFINFANDREVKAYRSAITGLEEKFDLSPAKLQSFLNRVKERVRVYNWANIINVAFPAPAAVAGVAQAAPPPINLITNYGQVTLAQVQAHATVYMALQQ